MLGVPGYAEALERQAKLLRDLESPSFVERIARNWEDVSAETMRGRLRSLGRELAVAETVFVDRPICTLLGTTADRGVPAWTLTDEGLPWEHGFCWFAANPGYRDDGDPNAVLRALSWSASWVNHELRDGAETSVITTDGPTEHAIRSFRALFVTPWYAHRDLPANVAPWTPLLWSFGTSSGDAVPQTAATGEPLSPQSMRDVRFLVGLFTALVLFLQQRILVAPQERADRATRRRLERDGWTHEPLIRVVQLRRREHSDQERSDVAAHVDWSCRWVVRGHWRQQPCGKGQAERRPVWVMPHVKGPESKPLKAPRATVFAVVR